MSSLPTVLVTGASTGIGARYADRFARRGHNLILVARDKVKLDALALQLSSETGTQVEVIVADLTDPGSLTRVERRLSADPSIGILVNNAGSAAQGGFLDQTPDQTEQLIDLNVIALTRLTVAAAHRFAETGSGAVINIGSVVGLAPEFGMSVYGATKAFVLYLSQALQLELGPRGVYIQAVLPAATRTEIWAKSGRDVDSIPGVMDVEDLVDAALAGFDRREAVTIPPLHDASAFERYDTARRAMAPGFANSRPAERYRVSERA